MPNYHGASIYKAQHPNLPRHLVYSNEPYIPPNRKQGRQPTIGPMLVRPKLEYGSIAWSPHTQNNIDTLEKIHRPRSAARFVVHDHQTRHNFVGEIRIFSVKICINPYPSFMPRENVHAIHIPMAIASRCSLQKNRDIV